MPSLSAHPIPRQEYERNLSIEVSRTSLIITYRLEVDDTTLLEAVRLSDNPEELAGLKGPKDFARVWANRMKVIIADRAIVKFNDKPMPVQIIKAKYDLRDSVIFLFQFKVDWQIGATPQTVTFEDLNFPDKRGRFKQALEISSDLIALEVKGEIDHKINDPEVQSPPEFRLKFYAHPFAEADNALMMSYLGRMFPPANLLTIMQSVPKTTPEPEPAAEIPSVDTSSEKLSRLYDSSAGMFMLLVLAAMFGAAHAITPGHGKTLVAAYLIGERGTLRHAVILGLSVTLAHTGSVLIVALGIWAFGPSGGTAGVQKWLTFAGGMIIILLGTWLFWRRLTGRVDHFHLFGRPHVIDGGEACCPWMAPERKYYSPTGTVAPVGRQIRSAAFAQTPSTAIVSPSAEAGPGTWRLMLIGFSGGIVPCHDAILLLLFALATGQLWLGIPLLLAFSVGLAAVLVGLGFAVVYARSMGLSKWADSPWLKRLPAVSAVLIIGVGCWLCLSSFDLV